MGLISNLYFVNSIALTHVKLRSFALILAGQTCTALVVFSDAAFSPVYRK